MTSGPDVSIRGRKASAYLMCAAALCMMLSACSGGTGGGAGGGGNGNSGNGNGGSGSGGSSGAPASTLSCDGYPMTGTNYVQVCLMTQQSVASTPNLSVTTNAGNLLGHGRDNLSSFTLYTQIVAQAADEATATALAKSVVVSTSNGSISETSNPVTSPENLSVNFEVFTAPTTNLTMNSPAGNMGADNYNATLQLTPQSGNVTLQTVQGQTTVNSTSGNVSLQTVQGLTTVNSTSGNVSLQTVQGQTTVKDQSGNVTLQDVQGQGKVNVLKGNIDVTLSGSGWTGAGLSATTNSGNVTVTRPTGYQAAFTATADVGIATIDSQSVTATNTPAVVTAGSGAPIVIESKSGNATVTTPQ